MTISFSKKNRLYHFVGLFCLSMLGCQKKDRYLSVTQYRNYLYGVLQTDSVKKTKKLIGDIGLRLSNFDSEKSKLTGPVDTFSPSPNPDSLVSLVDLLPNNNEIEGWSHVQPPKIYNGRELYYDVPFGNPQLYFRYGFQKQAHVEFQSPKLGGRPLILAEVFDLGTAANAYSLFSSIRLPQDQYRMIGSKMAAEMDDRLLFCKGQYLVDIEMYEYATAINQAVTDIAEKIEEQIMDINDGHLSEVPLISVLPVENHILHSTYLNLDQNLPSRYWPLSNLLTDINPKSVFRTYNDRHTEYSNAAYHGFVMEFTDKESASQCLESIQDKLVDHYGSDAADKIGSQGTSAIMMKYRTNQ